MYAEIHDNYHHDAPLIQKYELPEIAPSLLQRLATLPSTTLTLLSLLSLTVLHLVRIRMLCRIKDIDWELQPNRALHNDRQVPPYGRWHRDENAGVVQVLLILVPSDAFLIAFFGPGTLLEGQTRDEHEQDSQEDPAEHAAI